MLTQIVKHPLTDAGLERFLKDWQTIPQELGLSERGKIG